MRATLMYAAGDVRVEDVPDPSIVEPTDAIIRVTSACICGSDLWPYADLEPHARPGGRWATRRSASSRTSAPTSARSSRGDLVVMPFAFSDGTCAFCQRGTAHRLRARRLLRRLRHQRRAGRGRARPLADGTLYALPVGEDDALMPSLLTLSDVLGTGHHAAVVGRRQARATRWPSSATAPSGCAA